MNAPVQPRLFPSSVFTTAENHNTVKKDGAMRSLPSLPENISTLP
jgi:hypothetical protein